MPKMHRPGLRHITRCDYARSAGWHVRIYRTVRGQKRCHAKFFGDAKHGKLAGLRRARAWRDAELGRLPPPQRNGGSAVPPGHGYVRRAVRPRRASSTECFAVWLRIEGRRHKSTSYSIAKHGERGARRRAEQWLAFQRAALAHRLGKGQKRRRA